MRAFFFIRESLRCGILRRTGKEDLFFGDPATCARFRPENFYLTTGEFASAGLPSSPRILPSSSL